MKRFFILVIATAALAACGSLPSQPTQAPPAVIYATAPPSDTAGGPPPQPPTSQTNGQQPGGPLPTGEPPPGMGGQQLGGQGQPPPPGGQQQGGQPQGAQQGGGQGPTSTVTYGPTLTPYTLDLAHLPIGDSKQSSGPQQGYLWQCPAGGGGGGAQATGSWFDEAAGTWDYNAKPIVDGSIAWNREMSITIQGTMRVITSNSLPNHPTGVYPVLPTDDAALYDRNPNTISAQTIAWSIPANPTKNAQPQCVPAGAIGISISGPYIFNAFDAENRDAVAHEIQDACEGHPQASGAYHYHNISTCVDNPNGSGHSPLVGYASDGFGIYGYRGENGQILTDVDLDACHGHTHVIEWDGKQVEMFHYHATYEFPYTIGCMWGTPTASDSHGGQQGGQQQGGQQAGQGGPGGQQGGQQGGAPPGGGQGGQQGGPPPSGGQQGGQQGGLPPPGGGQGGGLPPPQP